MAGPRSPTPSPFQDSGDGKLLSDNYTSPPTTITLPRFLGCDAAVVEAIEDPVFRRESIASNRCAGEEVNGAAEPAREVGVSAMRAGLDRKTARKYRDLGKLPSEVPMRRDWRTREDPFKEDWLLVVAMLRDAPELEGR